MGFIGNTDPRRIIPRWRTVRQSIESGELSFVPDRSVLPPRLEHVLLEEQELAWKANRSLPYAADLLGSALVLGRESTFKDAAEFILETLSDKTAPIYSVALKALGREPHAVPAPDPELGNIIEMTMQLSSINSERSRIRRMKLLLREEPNNSVGWIELARSYSVLGQVAKAELAIQRALYCNRDNRFIVRSASRFYHHYYRDEDYAIKTIKRSKFCATDPWLLASEIAYSTVLGRFSRSVKIGRQYLDNFVNDPFGTSELASAIGTIDYQEGDKKKAKRNFKRSLIQPNDNSLAQAKWMSKDGDLIIIDEEDFELPYAFEARMLSAYAKGEFLTSLNNSIRWHVDEPYSIRPILAASYIAGVFLDRSDLSIQLLRRGLDINSTDLRLLNNLVFFLGDSGHLDEAMRLFSEKVNGQIIENASTLEERLSLTATSGLLLFKAGFHKEGRIQYKRAIETAKDNQDQYLLSLATLNLVKQEIVCSAGDVDLTEQISKAREIAAGMTEPDILHLLAQIEELFQKRLAEKL